MIHSDPIYKVYQTVFFHEHLKNRIKLTSVANSQISGLCTCIVMHE